MAISKVLYKEGGLISGNRLYLRMMRERLAFEACAAPFGNTFFFSCRTVYSPAVVRLRHILLIVFISNVIYSCLFRLLGFGLGTVAFGALIIAIFWMLRDAVSAGLSDFDAWLLKIPALGLIYETRFRKDSYYREDTRLVYLKLIPELIKNLAEEVTGAKGIKLLVQYEKAPIYGDVYARVLLQKKIE
jgi:hypothetical protein